MAKAFRHIAGAYVAQLDEDEARLVVTLARDVLQLLGTREEEGASGGAVEDATGSVPHAEGRDDASGTTWWEELGLSDPEATHHADSLQPPTDPALARLLPNVSADDPEEQARLRAELEPHVIATKRQALHEAIDLLRHDPLRVTEEAAPRFGAALNDIRLVLAERLGIQDESGAERVAKLAQPHSGRGAHGVDDVEHFMAMLYSFVSWLQDSLMTALLKRR
jgi:hypothetical protein